MNYLLEIKDLYVSIDQKEILKGIHLQVPYGEMHALMGPNGSGKSTLAKVLSGHPAYQITRGEIWFKGQNLLEKLPEERAHLGLFQSFQYPPEITGVGNGQFLHLALNALRRARSLPPLSEEEFMPLLDQKMNEMQIRSEFKQRNINEGFSGGEKKKNEILQLCLFEPDLAILDETDSGLDIDAMRIVAEGIHRFKTGTRSLLVITHYPRLLELIHPDRVHVLLEGRIVRSGGKQLALELEREGYEILDES